jgi:hypothetical protein
MKAGKPEGGKGSTAKAGGTGVARGPKAPVVTPGETNHGTGADGVGFPHLHLVVH